MYAPLLRHVKATARVQHRPRHPTTMVSSILAHPELQRRRMDKAQAPRRHLPAVRQSTHERHRVVLTVIFCRRCRMFEWQFCCRSDRCRCVEQCEYLGRWFGRPCGHVGSCHVISQIAQGNLHISRFSFLDECSHDQPRVWWFVEGRVGHLRGHI